MEKLIEDLNAIVDGRFFKVLDVIRINQHPHPYVIGPRHIAWADDHHGGMLSKHAIIEGEKYGKCSCACKGCNVPYEEHTIGNKVCIIQLQQNCPHIKAQQILKKLSEAEEFVKESIEGFVFVDTPEKFRIV